MTKKSSARKKKLFWKKHGYRIFSLGVVILLFLFMPGTNYYETMQLEPRPPLVRASQWDNFAPAPYPKKIGLETPPYLTAESVVVRDLDSAVPMYELNPAERLRPASITKLMTALVSLEFYSPEQVITVKRLAPVNKDEPESEMGLAIGDKVSVQNLLYGLLVPSGNDAAYTLADNYPGGIENFLYAMNKKAENLHLENTHFDNPVGIDSPKQYSTARDLSLLAVEALKSELISKIVSTSGITLNDAAGKKQFIVKNVNQLLGYVYGVDGVKTGYTSEAGQCLISSVSRNNHRVIIVLLKSQDRFGESAQLIRWVFNNFNWINLSN